MKTNQASIPRKLMTHIRERLQHMPAVVILGPRQVGKTTLAKYIVSDYPNAQFLDLENNQDRQILQEPELFLPFQREKLVIIDEIQFAPEIFRALRPEIVDILPSLKKGDSYHAYAARASKVVSVGSCFTDRSNGIGSPQANKRSPRSKILIEPTVSA